MIGSNAIEKTLPLFPESTNLQHNDSQLALIRLSDDTEISESALRSFGDLVLESEDLYPGIDKWFEKKVIPGIKEGSRIAYVVFYQGKAIAESIVRFGTDTKMCSMRVDPAFQGKGIGPFLFAQLANELDYSIKSIHFTAPESLMIERKGLFDDLGFVFAGKNHEKYRSGQDEFVFRASASQFRKQSLELVSKKIGKNFLRKSIPGILMAIKGEYVEKILSGQKCVEIRRRFSNENQGCVALLYATQPVGKVLGDALISSIVSDHPEKIWKEFHSFIGVDKVGYDQYCHGAENVKAIILSHISKYPHPFDWDSVKDAFVGIKRPPQSFQRIPKASLSFWGSLSSPENNNKGDTDHSLGL